MSIAQIPGRFDRSPATIKGYFYDPLDANKGPYTSLGATRAVYGAPGAESRPGPQERTHAAMARRRQPDARSRPALERTPRLVDGAGALRLRGWLEYRCSRNTT